MTIKIDPNAYDAITFDCYGTLIDWEAGLMSYIQPLLRGARRARGAEFPARLLRPHRKQTAGRPVSPVSQDSRRRADCAGRAARLSPLCRCVGGISRQHRRLGAVPGYDRVAESTRLALSAGRSFRTSTTTCSTSRKRGSTSTSITSSRPRRSALTNPIHACSKRLSNASACRKSGSCTWHKACITTLRPQRRWASTRCGSTGTTATAAVQRLRRMRRRNGRCAISANWWKRCPETDSGCARADRTRIDQHGFQRRTLDLGQATEAAAMLPLSVRASPQRCRRATHRRPEPLPGTRSRRDPLDRHTSAR